jgi:rotatin
MALLPSALRVVRSLVQNLMSVRRDMAQSMELHYLAIRCALLLRQDANACRDAAELLMLLVFDECFRLQPQ